MPPKGYKKIAPDGIREMIDKYRSGTQVNEILDEYQIDRRTFYRWLNEYRQDVPSLGRLTRMRLQIMIEGETDFDNLMRLMSIAAKYDKDEAEGSGPREVDISKHGS